MASRIYTIGHSNRTLEAFLDLLREFGVRRLVDVRTMSRSRANPQFNADTLEAALAAQGIAYERSASLGGLRSRSRETPVDVNAYWSNASFHNYADYAMSAPFRAGLDHLVAEAQVETCAIMCAEAVWWRCHRRIIADYLIAAGVSVVHIMGSGRAEEAHLTEGAVVRSDGTLVYPSASD